MAKRPSFLFIMTDQHRADHLGCTGNPVVKTPAIDSLAANGSRFDRFYVANPICMPNRSSIMTGRMSTSHGVRHNGVALSMEHTTFVDVLRDAGYRTALIGKSHLQNFTRLPAIWKYQEDPNKQSPSALLRDAVHHTRSGPDYELERDEVWDRTTMERWPRPYYGFEHFEIVTDHADRADGDYMLWAENKHPGFKKLVGPANAIPDDRYNAPQAWRTSVPEELYSTNWIAERAEEKLESYAHADAPFFLKVSFPDPHHPFTPPGKYWDMYDPADIELPASFGKSKLDPVAHMQALMRSGKDPRDNQSPFAVTEDEARQIIALTYGMITMIDDAVARLLAKLKSLGLDDDTVVVFTADHGDFMGEHSLMLKFLLHFQGLIRIPFIWRDPAADMSEKRSDLGQSIDIAPTILARAGINPYHGIQGRDLFDSTPPSGVLVEEDSSRPFAGFAEHSRLRTLVTPDWRMTMRGGDTWNEMYDLRNDPHELNNLYDNPSSRQKRDELTGHMLRRIIELQDDSPLPSGRA